MLTERLGHLKISQESHQDLTGNQTRDLVSCGAAPEPIANVTKYREIRWVRHAARKGDMINVS
jgi:hypothetical protein